MRHRYLPIQIRTAEGVVTHEVWMGEPGMEVPAVVGTPHRTLTLQEATAIVRVLRRHESA